MVDLVPELTLLIGDQPPVPELAATGRATAFPPGVPAVHRRVRPAGPSAGALPRRSAMARCGEALAVLGYVDTGWDVKLYIVIGAYRDNEVTAAHPLLRKLDAIKTAGGKVTEITLAPLARAHLGQLLADALRCGSLVGLAQLQDVSLRLVLPRDGRGVRRAVAATPPAALAESREADDVRVGTPGCARSGHTGHFQRRAGAGGAHGGTSASLGLRRKRAIARHARSHAACTPRFIRINMWCMKRSFLRRNTKRSKSWRGKYQSH